MAEEIGKIVKPEAEGFVAKRKIYVVPLIFRSKMHHWNMSLSSVLTGTNKESIYPGWKIKSGERNIFIMRRFPSVEKKGLSYSTN